MLFYILYYNIKIQFLLNYNIINNTLHNYLYFIYLKNGY